MGQGAYDDGSGLARGHILCLEEKRLFSPSIESDYWVKFFVLLNFIY